MLQRSVSLEAAVNDQEYSNFCAEKAENSTDESEKSVWEFLRVRCINLGTDLIWIGFVLQVTFEPDTRRQYLRLLGYDTEELEQKVLHIVKCVHLRIIFSVFCFFFSCQGFGLVPWQLGWRDRSTPVTSLIVSPLSLLRTERERARHCLGRLKVS